MKKTASYVFVYNYTKHSNTRKSNTIIYESMQQIRIKLNSNWFYQPWLELKRPNAFLCVWCDTQVFTDLFLTLNINKLADFQ